MPEPTDEELWLTPPPRRVRREGGWVELPAEWASFRGDAALVRGALGQSQLRLAAAGGRDPGWLRVEFDDPTERGLSADQQRYALRIAPPVDGAAGAAGSTVNIRAQSRAGARHGLATLAQLLRRFGNRLPRVEIDDGPSFATRGVMLDVSRCRVPTMPELFSIVEMLAGLKVNHLQLYTEHTFAYTGHEEAWRGWSPLTAEEVRRLDAHCLAHGIELAANQNCFGHLAHWLKMPRYAGLAETHGDWMFDVWPRSGAFSLCPTDPGSLALVEDWLRQLLPCFTSGLVNIGCDETFDVGWGRSKAEVEKRGKGAVCAGYIEKVAAAARAHGKRAMMWGDLLAAHPEAAREIGEDVVALVWGYEPDTPFGEWCDAARRQAGRDVWVCPGTSSWRSIAGRTSERRANILRAAREGVDAGATGMLLCDWGDTGHHQVWPVAAMGIADGAAAAWNSEAAGEFDARAAAFHVLGDRAGETGPWLEALGDADLPLREVCLGLSRPGLKGRLKNQGALFADLHNAKWGEHIQVGASEDWKRVRARVEELAGPRPRVAPLVDDELAHTLEVMRFAADRAVWRRGPEAEHAAARLNLRERLIGIITEHRRLWAVRSRPGGLEQSVGFYGKVRDGMV